MRVLSKKTLRDFWDIHPQAAVPLALWYARVSAASWDGPADVRREFGSADFVAGNRIIFDIGGNKYRLVAYVAYRHKQVMIKFVGTHKQYDSIDPETV